VALGSPSAFIYNPAAAPDRPGVPSTGALKMKKAIGLAIVAAFLVAAAPASARHHHHCWYHHHHRICR
jgi:hypothetical protein